jgi:hypothetical protein
MISKSLSTSEKRAVLHECAGKLAEFCQALYPLIVAHADDWGCIQGDVFTVKHLVDPTSPRKLADFETALMHLHNVGLIVWYEADGKRVVYVSAFSDHQQLRGHDKDGRKRTLPPPPENISKFDVGRIWAKARPESPKSALREEKRTEEKRTEPIQSPKNLATAEDGGEEQEDNEDRGVRGGDIRAFVQFFCEEYSRRRFGARYMVIGSKHIPLVKRLLRVYTLERLKKLATILLTTDEEWVTGTDRGIGILSTKASWLDGLLAEHEAKRAS